MLRMKKSIRIGIQTLVWEMYKINIPNLNLLLTKFNKTGPMPMPLPQQEQEILDFVNGEFGNYLQPIPGFVCTKRYLKISLDQAGINLVKVDSVFGVYKDIKTNTYWRGFEGRYSDSMGDEFVLLGRDLIPDLSAA